MYVEALCAGVNETSKARKPLVTKISEVKKSACVEVFSVFLYIQKIQIVRSN